MSFFGRRLKQFLPDVTCLLAPTGRATIASWLRTLVWSIYACEKEHASCRRLVQGTGPSRNWTLCGRERLLERSRTVHMERTTCDPGRAPPTADAGSAERLAATLPNVPQVVDNPLAAVPETPLPILDFQIAGVAVDSDMSVLVRSAPQEAPAMDAEESLGVAPVGAHIMHAPRGSSWGEGSESATDHHTHSL